MKKLFFLSFCLFPMLAQSFQYDVQFENDRVIVYKWVVEPHEQVPLHRKALPRVVIAGKDGTITRTEADGSKHDVHFPANQAVFLEADPEGQKHTGINNTSEKLEAFVIELKK